MSDYPEHERMRTVEPGAQVIGEFIEWLNDQHMVICWATGADSGETIDQLLARYYQINLDVIEQEKRTMIKELQALNTKGGKA